MICQRCGRPLPAGEENFSHHIYCETRPKLMRGNFWPAGTLGLIHTPHRGDSQEPARAKVFRDCPPDAEDVEIELLDDFYCLSEGDRTTAQRYLFEPTAA